VEITAFYAGIFSSLQEVVQETMQPSHVSLWVRQFNRAKTPSLQIGKPPPFRSRST